ncbi:hypothetical protein CsSME_00016847 [Camellia sinensis var. sinensis]
MEWTWSFLIPLSHTTTLPPPSPPLPQLRLHHPTSWTTRLAGIWQPLRPQHHAISNPRQTLKTVQPSRLAPARLHKHHGSPHCYRRHRAIQKPRPLLFWPDRLRRLSVP